MFYVSLILAILMLCLVVFYSYKKQLFETIFFLIFLIINLIGASSIYHRDFKIKDPDFYFSGKIEKITDCNFRSYLDDNSKNNMRASKIFELYENEELYVINGNTKIYRILFLFPVENKDVNYFLSKKDVDNLLVNDKIKMVE
jgi:hypothetical protein